MPESNLSLRVGDEVAVMSFGGTSPTDVLEISKVVFIRAFTVELENGRLYAQMDGRGLLTNDCIVLATGDHRAALKSKSAGQSPG